MSKARILTYDEEWLGDLEPIEKPYGVLSRIEETAKPLIDNLDTINNQYLITIEVEKL